MSELFREIDESYAEYLTDESFIIGEASTISFPESEAEVVEVLRQTAQKGERVTVQGARTGLSAGASPCGGHIINLSKMNQILNFAQTKEGFMITVQAGVVLKELNETIVRGKLPFACDTAAEFAKNPRYFFPPDPTESLATIGGMISCNASGACSYAYGATRDYIRRIKVALANGTVKEFSREEDVEIPFALPHYSFDRVKNAAGYYAKADAQFIDLFIGAEGTLGIVLEADLLLIKAEEKAGCMCFFEERDTLFSLVDAVRKIENPDAKIVAIEYMDKKTLAMIDQLRETISSFGELPIYPQNHGALYFEMHGQEEGIDEILEQLADLFDKHQVDENAVMFASSPQEMKKLKLLRHAAPESADFTVAANKRNYKSLTNICTDLAVPHDRMREALHMYVENLKDAGLSFVIYGHIGNDHLHVNILPDCPTQYETGMNLYHAWMRQVTRWGGTITAEHGIGKQKNFFSHEFFGEENYQKMLEIKKALDPGLVLNSENIFGAF